MMRIRITGLVVALCLCLPALADEPNGQLSVSPQFAIGSIKLASGDQAGAPVDVCENCGEKPCSCAPKYLFGADWLYLQPRGSDIGLAVPSDEAFGVPLARTEQLDYDYQSGFRGRVGLALECSNWVMFTWTTLDADTATSGFAGPGRTLLTQVLVSPNPLSADASSTSFVAAHGEIDFDTYDLDLSRTISSCGVDWTGFLGARVATLDEDLRVLYDEDFVRSSVDIRGGGIRGGVGARWWRGCWSIFGNTGLSLMASDVDVKYQQLNDADGLVVDYEQDLDDRIIPILDLELGLSYDFRDCLSVSAGYMYSIWFNAVTTPALIRDLQRADLSGDTEDDLSFDGFFARAEVRW